MILRLLLVFSLIMVSVGLGYVAWHTLVPGRDVTLATEGIEPPPPPVRILVAAQALPVATLLKDGDLVVREVPPDAVPEGVLVESDDVRAEVRGALLRRYLDAGSPILRADVLRLRDRGFLAAVLRPGTRAISIGVDAVTGAAGLIWPGDQVDLILTQEIEADGTDKGRRVAGETVLTDVRIIAVDQQIALGRSDVEEERKAPQTVTLEVTPEQAERVAVAARLGSIALSVRAVDGAVPAVIADRTGPVYGADVSAALLTPPPAVAARMRVIQGSDQQDVVLP
ncbi:Flp pilus assembly protein CpaB [Geminicoccus harenae]|uniref:Flp pilus assembly protein CpaB n=1 Tax=Geminicoccus harenae TaxID=2498453 RepID=UPI00168A470E|nr:Flp pilus assembly protein CpaB [Geminicoccus harenae]